MSNQNPNYLFSNFCACSHTEADRLYHKGCRSRTTMSLHAVIRVPHDWTVSFWPGHTQNSCWNPSEINGTRRRELLCGNMGRAHVIGTSVLTMEDPERTVVASCCWPWFWTSNLHSCQNRIPVVDKLLTALYLTIASHKQRELKVQEGQQSPCNLETSSPSLSSFLKAPPQNLRSNGTSQNLS